MKYKFDIIYNDQEKVEEEKGEVKVKNDLKFSIYLLWLILISLI